MANQAALSDFRVLLSERGVEKIEDLDDPGYIFERTGGNNGKVSNVFSFIIGLNFVANVAASFEILLYFIKCLTKYQRFCRYTLWCIIFFYIYLFMCFRKLGSSSTVTHIAYHDFETHFF